MNGTYETKLDSLCGFDRPNTIVSFSNFIKINFQTDSDQEYKGFIGIYKAIDCEKK